MTNALLQKARAVRPHQRRAYTNDEIEVALHWLSGDVSFTGAAQVLTKNKGGRQVYGILALCLLMAHQRGQLKIIKKRPV